MKEDRENHSKDLAAAASQNSQSILARILSLFYTTQPQHSQDAEKEDRIEVFRKKFQQQPLALPKNKNKRLSPPLEEDDKTTPPHYAEPKFYKKNICKLPPDYIKEEAINAAYQYGKTILYDHFSPIFHTPDTHKNKEYIKLMMIIIDYINWEDYQTRICLTKSREQAPQSS
jgi:hypothetical protein